MDEFVAMAGSPTAAVATMQAFALKHDCKAVVMNAAKDADGFKGLAAVPATTEEQALVEAVAARVAGAPGNLPKELQDNSLYAKQGILDHGFGLQHRPELSPLKAFRMRNEISRKTMLPRAVTP